MPTYSVTSNKTTAMTGTSVSAISREAAINSAISTIAASGPTGAEVHVGQCVQTAASGPTGTYSVTTNYTSAVTGSTYSAVSHTDAVAQAVAALGPTGLNVLATNPPT